MNAIANTPENRGFGYRNQTTTEEVIKMPKDFAIITIHGMGDTKEDYYKGLETGLRKEVGEDTWDSRVHLEHVYYQVSSPTSFCFPDSCRTAGPVQTL